MGPDRLDRLLHRLTAPVDVVEEIAGALPPWRTPRDRERRERMPACRRPARRPSKPRARVVTHRPHERPWRVGWRITAWEACRAWAGRHAGLRGGAAGGPMASARSPSSRVPLRTPRARASPVRSSQLIAPPSCAASTEVEARHDRRRARGDAQAGAFAPRRGLTRFGVRARLVHAGVHASCQILETYLRLGAGAPPAILFNSTVAATRRPRSARSSRAARSQRDAHPQGPRPGGDRVRARLIRRGRAPAVTRQRRRRPS